MTDDLLERLRLKWLVTESPPREVTGGRVEALRNPDGPEAADRIEALEAENARLREIIENLKEGWENGPTGSRWCSATAHIEKTLRRFEKGDE